MSLVYPLINSKLISKLARFFAIVSFVFVIFLAIVTFYILQIANSSAAPLDYVVLVILSTIAPYLFIAVLSGVIAVVAGKVEPQLPEEEALPPVTAQAANA
jgi:hypothetical protein